MLVVQENCKLRSYGLALRCDRLLKQMILHLLGQIAPRSNDGFAYGGRKLLPFGPAPIAVAGSSTGEEAENLLGLCPVLDRRSVQGAVLPMMLCYLTPVYFVPYARSPASPRPGTMNARSSRDSSIAAVQIGTSGWAPRIRSMP